MYVRTQLSIATTKGMNECRSRKIKKLTGKDEVSTKEKNECRSYKLACTEQPHVRTQLAIATTEQPYVRLSTREKRRKFNVSLAQISKRTRKSLTSKNEFESCNEQLYVRTQLAIAMDVTKKRWAEAGPHKQDVHNQAVRMYTASYRYYVRTQLAIAVKVLQITKVRQAESIREKQERNKFINTVKDYAYLLLTTFADPS